MVKESLNPSKERGGIIITKDMHISEQIRAQDKKKGSKHFYIDSEESVDWLIKQFVAPEFSKKSYQQFRREKDALIASGEIPADPEE